MTMRFGSRPSNGTEGDIQRAYTCDRCTRDHDWHLMGRDDEQPDESCPIIMDAIAGEHSYPNEEGPPQWGHDFDTGEWVCTEFDGPCACASEPVLYEP